MPFIKSEDGKLDFVHQIMNTTQASLNGYFPTSLQNVVSLENIESFVRIPRILYFESGSTEFRFKKFWPTQFRRFAKIMLNGLKI